MMDILAIFAPAPADALDQPARHVFTLAHELDARLSVLITAIGPSHAAPPGEPDNMQGDESQRAPSLDDSVARTAALVRDQAQAAGVDYVILPPADEKVALREQLIARAQVRDLTVVGTSGPLVHPRLGLVEAALFGSGRPVLLMPPAAQAFSDGTILVGWDATRAAVRALHDAMPLLRRARRVVIASVSDDSKALPLAASGPAICDYLARHDINAGFQALQRQQRSVGEALLVNARGLGANLLVMGGFGHAREREFLFGSATRDVLQSYLDIPVLLSH